MLKPVCWLQLADLLEDKAQTVTEKTPQVTEDLQSKAEEHAGRVAKQARPMADQASDAIEGGAKRVADGVHPQAERPCALRSEQEWVDRSCNALWGACRLSSFAQASHSSVSAMSQTHQVVEGGSASKLAALHRSAAMPWDVATHLYLLH